MSTLFLDFQPDPNGDLLFQNGDLVIGPSDQQNIEDILLANPGDWKQFPQLGVGIENYENSSGTEQEIMRLVKTMLTSDGFTVGNIQVSFNSNGQLVVAPNAVRQ